jgi:hypothetical protein
VPIHLKRLSPSGKAETPFSPDIMRERSSCCSRLVTECLSLCIAVDDWLFVAAVVASLAPLVAVVVVVVALFEDIFTTRIDYYFLLSELPFLAY